MKFKEVFKGIDSLYVSYKGVLREGLKEYLEERKRKAQSDDEMEQVFARMSIDDHVFEVMDRGAKGFHLSWLIIGIAYRYPEVEGKCCL